MFTLSKDTNGNKICKFKPVSGRSFSVQTLGNMPEAHRMSKESLFVDSYATIEKEFKRYILEHGTQRQRQALKLNELDLFDYYELLPDAVRALIDDAPEAGESYQELNKLLEKLKPHGFTFECGLANPYNLTKIEE